MNLTVLLTGLVLSVAVISSCEPFYIVPVNSTERCETEPCLTLDQLAGEVANKSFSDLTLYFFPGNHFVNQNLNISNVETINVIGSSSDTIVWFQGPNNLTMKLIIL